MDWKDMLAGLKADLPEGEEPDVNENEDAQRSSGKCGPKETLHVVMEKKGRAGKTATVIEGFECDENRLKEIASELKMKIGVGGSARGGEILLQGDWRQRAAELLRNMGYKVKGI